MKVLCFITSATPITNEFVKIWNENENASSKQIKVGDDRLAIVLNGLSRNYQADQGQQAKKDQWNYQAIVKTMADIISESKIYPSDPIELGINLHVGKKTDSNSLNQECSQNNIPMPQFINCYRSNTTYYDQYLKNFVTQPNEQNYEKLWSLSKGVLENQKSDARKTDLADLAHEVLHDFSVILGEMERCGHTNVSNYVELFKEWESCYQQMRLALNAKIASKFDKELPAKIAQLKTALHKLKSDQKPKNIADEFSLLKDDVGKTFHLLLPLCEQLRRNSKNDKETCEIIIKQNSLYTPCPDEQGKYKILFVDDEWKKFAMDGKLQPSFNNNNLTLHFLDSHLDAMKWVADNKPAAVLLDAIFKNLDGEYRTSISTYKAIRKEYPDLPVIIISQTMHTDQYQSPYENPAGEWYKNEIFLNPDEHMEALKNIISDSNAVNYDYGFLVGNTAKMKAVAEQIQKFAKTKSTVLINGETGTGKELVAKAIHKISGRTGDLVTIDCTAIPEKLVESELFGIYGGTANDVKEKKGKFLIANEGSIFLDEIGELDMDIQAKLLRVLENKKITPVGASKKAEMEIPVDVIVVAATHKDLYQCVTEGKFRQDLFYRLNVLHLVLPPLRERKEDIEELVKHFIRVYNEENNTTIARKVRTDVLEMLKNHAWPGNIRELRNAVYRACSKAYPTHTILFDWHFEIDADRPFQPSDNIKQKVDYSVTENIPNMDELMERLVNDNLKMTHRDHVKVTHPC